MRSIETQLILGHKVFLSILIPTWNRGQLVRRTVDSISFFPPDLEVILVDDGSRESEYQVLQKVAQEYPNVKLFRNTDNLGMVKNWNRCISYSTGQWMGMIADDDIYRKDAIRRVYELLKELEEPTLIIQDPTIFQEIEKLLPGPGTVKILNLPIASGNFWHREIVHSIGGFDVRCKYSADAEFWSRVAYHFPVVRVKNPFASFVRNTDSYMWKTWKEEDFLEQTALLIRLSADYHFAKGQSSKAFIEKSVDDGLWRTILTILSYTFLVRDKQDTFCRYFREAINRANTFRRKIVLIYTLLRVIPSLCKRMLYTTS